MPVRKLSLSHSPGHGNLGLTPTTDDPVPFPDFKRKGHKALSETKNIDTTPVVTAPSRSFKINKKNNPIYSSRSPAASGKSSAGNSHKNSPKISLHGSPDGEISPRQGRKPLASSFAHSTPPRPYEVAGKQPSKFQDYLPARLAMGTPDATAQRQKISMYLKKENVAENIFVINNSPISVARKKRSLTVSYSPIVTKKESDTHKPRPTLTESSFYRKQKNLVDLVSLTPLKPKIVLSKRGTSPNKPRNIFFSEKKEASIERNIKFKDLDAKFSKTGELKPRSPFNMKNRTANDSFRTNGFSPIRKRSNFSSTHGKGAEINPMNLTMDSFPGNNTSVGIDTFQFDPLVMENKSGVRENPMLFQKVGKKGKLKSGTKKKVKVDLSNFKE